MIKILAFAGSSRKESFNKKLLKIAVLGAQKHGGYVTLIDLTNYPMPIFNQDLEQEHGIPENARKLKQLMVEHNALMIASPEYNSAFSPLLKNVIDWTSRVETDQEPPLVAFKDKLAVIMAASPGTLGGLRGLVFLRMLLANIGVTVLPNQETIPTSFKAFNDDGSLIDKKKHEAVLGLGRELFFATSKLQG